PVSTLKCTAARRPAAAAAASMSRAPSRSHTTAVAWAATAASASARSTAPRNTRTGARTPAARTVRASSTVKTEHRDADLRQGLRDRLDAVSVRIVLHDGDDLGVLGARSQRVVVRDDGIEIDVDDGAAQGHLRAQRRHTYGRRVRRAAGR